MLDRRLLIGGLELMLKTYICVFSIAVGVAFSNLQAESSDQGFMELCLKKDSLPEPQRDFIDFLMTSNQCGRSLRRLAKVPILSFKDTYVDWTLLKEAKSLRTLRLNSYKLETLNFLRGMSKLKNLVFENIHFSHSVDLMVLKQLPQLRSITIISSKLSDEHRLFLSHLPGIELQFTKKKSNFS